MWKLPDHASVATDKDSFARMFPALLRQRRSPERQNGSTNVQDTRYLVHNPAQLPPSAAEIDAVLWTALLPHDVPPLLCQSGSCDRPWRPFVFALTTHRGCFGECRFLRYHASGQTQDRSRACGRTGPRPDGQAGPRKPWRSFVSMFCGSQEKRPARISTWPIIWWPPIRVATQSPHERSAHLRQPPTKTSARTGANIHPFAVYHGHPDVPHRNAILFTERKIFVEKSIAGKTEAESDPDRTSHPGLA